MGRPSPSATSSGSWPGPTSKYRWCSRVFLAGQGRAGVLQVDHANHELTLQRQVQFFARQFNRNRKSRFAATGWIQPIDDLDAGKDLLSFSKRNVGHFQAIDVANQQGGARAEPAAVVQTCRPWPRPFCLLGCRELHRPGSTRATDHHASAEPDRSILAAYRPTGSSGRGDSEPRRLRRRPRSSNAARRCNGHVARVDDGMPIGRRRVLHLRAIMVTFRGCPLSSIPPSATRLTISDGHPVRPAGRNEWATTERDGGAAAAELRRAAAVINACVRCPSFTLTLGSKKWEATLVADAGRACSSFGDGSRLPRPINSVRQPATARTGAHHECV